MAARLLDTTEMFQLLCKTQKKWGLMITPNFHYSSVDEVYKAVPYLAPKTTFVYEGQDSSYQVMGDGLGFFLFDTEAELDLYYESTVGDDGPMKHNKYKGPACVYALTCDPDGCLMNENT